MVHGVPGQHGQSVMAVLGHPPGPGSVAVLLPDLVDYPVLERAGKATDATTTSLCAQVSIMNSFAVNVGGKTHKPKRNIGSAEDVERKEKRPYRKQLVLLSVFLMVKLGWRREPTCMESACQQAC